MARVTYEYDKDAVDLTTLAGEIRGSSIANVATELLGAKAMAAPSPDNNVFITWANALSTADKTKLDDLVTAHGGVSDVVAGVSDVEIMEFDVDVTTEASTYTGIPGLGKKLPAGTWRVTLSGSVEHSTLNDSIFTAIRVAGVVVPQSEREFRRGDRAAAVVGSFYCEALITIDATSTVEGVWKEVTGGEATMHQGQMTLECVNRVTF